LRSIPGFNLKGIKNKYDKSRGLGRGSCGLDAESNRGLVDAEGERSSGGEGDALRCATGGSERQKTEAQTSQDHDKIIDHLAVSEHEESFMNGVCFQ
jgi:hypothetical protein